MRSTDVLVIGAGPSGALASKLLHQKGYDVTVLERACFPRFSIGESLLPHAMSFLEEAGMVEVVRAHDFQHKDGASFFCNGQKSVFDFHHKYTEGPATTYQVQRADFDKLLADNAQAAGVDIRYGETITAVDMTVDSGPILSTKNEQGEQSSYQSRFVLDASGFGRVLPRLLDMEAPSGFPVRQSLFTHIQDNIVDTEYDRNKISIVVHPENHQVWYWLIPFADGRCSLGVVAEESFFSRYDCVDDAELLKQLITESPDLAGLLGHASYDQLVNRITGYSANVSKLYGDNFLLLGNAGEFLDPVFSSGVTIALKSASLAAGVVDRVLSGHDVDIQKEYATHLQKGVDTFRTYVEAWYSGGFQNIIFYPDPSEDIKAMICSILAGYAWDENNPFVAQSQRRMDALIAVCSQD